MSKFNDASNQAELRNYQHTDHQIEESFIDPDALYVLKKLHDAGYSAYIVGGGVRDLLLRKVPKDFDISTSARPEEVKRVFGKNCLLIGRRFRLAHIRFGHKIIEVATFRTGENEGDLIVQDNQWGSAEEDVLRRDFTINGLFYDAQERAVIDYVNGWDDVKDGLLRTIGDPVIRFKQDPVRMIRLLKFQARLDFRVEERTLRALDRCQHEIVKSAPARILEEMLRMLESGYSAVFFRLMTESGLLEHLFPPLSHFLQSRYGHEVYDLLQCADEYNRKDLKRPLDRSLLCSCLVYPILVREIETQYTSKDKVPHINEIMLLSDALIDAVVATSFSHFPKRISSQMAFILITQYRLTPIVGKKHHRPKLMQNREFELALQLLRLRATLDEKWMDDYRFWRNAYKIANKQHHEISHANHKRHHSQPTLNHHADTAENLL